MSDWLPYWNELVPDAQANSNTNSHKKLFHEDDFWQVLNSVELNAAYPSVQIVPIQLLV